jgi:acetoin utilization protein AcuC
VEAASFDLAGEFRRLVGDADHHSIHDLNQLEDDTKLRLYSLLVPARIYDLLGIDRATFTNREGERVVEVKAPRRGTFAIIEVREHPGDQDCVFFLEIEDTAFFKIDINFLIVNDPRSPRFNTDVDEAGRRTKFATVRRNIPEEIRAMEAGLAPGQVRRGLRVFKDFVPLARDFVAAMGQDMVIAEPLAYNNAIIFESYGFNYIRGRRRMEEIHAGFQPGGELYARLDGSTPFRRPGMEKTVRGRAWAIHDGILGEPWRGIEMYRGREPADVCTFPGWVY